VGSMIADDVREDIQAALRFATNKARLVIVTGGLGPTPNDITRETVADFAGIKLQEDPAAIATMERRFNQTKDQLRPNLRRQALVPSRGGFLKNPNGTAVGLIFDLGGTVIVALPGPPRELQPMVRDELAPFLQKRYGIRSFGLTLTLRFVGAGQSLIDQTIKDHISVAPDVTITSLFEGSRVDFMFSLPGHGPEDKERLKRLGDGIREHLAEYIYADDNSSLEEVVVRKLRAHGGSLVMVEVGSGGHLAASLSGVEGLSQLLAGAYCAPNEEAMSQLLQIGPEKRGKSGPERAKALATAAASLTQSKWAVAVGPVEADEKGTKSVWVAFQSAEDGWEPQRVVLRDSGEVSRSTLTTQILDKWRRLLK
jgi:nicotinamide-nucleotide amidase